MTHRNWKTWRFDQMAVNVNDRIDNPSEADVEHYVGLEHLDPDSLKIRRWGAPSDVEATKLLFRKGDIIFGRRRAYQRKLAVADFDGICSAHAMVLRAKPDVVLPEFLPFFMQSDLFMNRAVEISVGSLSPTINWKTLAAQEFALPPLEEQRRMAEVFAGVESILEATRNLESTSECLRKSLVMDLFSRLVGKKDVSWVSVADAGDVLMGRQRSPQYDQGIMPRPYLRVANVYDGFIDVNDIKQMDFSETEFQQYKLLLGDVLLNEGQSRELVGRSCIFRGEIPDCCFQNTLIRFRPIKTSSEYAHQYFRYCLYSGRFVAIAKQTTSIAHLGSTRFAAMSFPLVDRRHEQQIVDELSSVEYGLLIAKHRRESAEHIKLQVLNSSVATPRM
jgi:restriction endonuclease S subunit